MSEEATGRVDLTEVGGRLDEVEEALERLETGSYGRCVGCGGEIGSERLSADPLARLCDSCQPAPLTEGG